MVSIETKQEILELIEKHKEELGDGMYKDLCDSLIDKRIKDDKDEKKNERWRKMTKLSANYACSATY